MTATKPLANLSDYPGRLILVGLAGSTLGMGPIIMGVALGWEGELGPGSLAAVATCWALAGALVVHTLFPSTRAQYALAPVLAVAAVLAVAVVPNWVAAPTSPLPVTGAPAKPLYSTGPVVAEQASSHATLNVAEDVYLTLQPAGRERLASQRWECLRGNEQEACDLFVQGLLLESRLEAQEIRDVFETQAASSDDRPGATQSASRRRESPLRVFPPRPPENDAVDGLEQL